MGWQIIASPFFYAVMSLMLKITFYLILDEPETVKYTLLENNAVITGNVRAKIVKVRYDSGKTGTITTQSPMDHTGETMIQVIDK